MLGVRHQGPARRVSPANSPEMASLNPVRSWRGFGQANECRASITPWRRLCLGCDLEFAIGASILVRLAGSTARGWLDLPALGTFDAESYRAAPWVCW
jgi:hypothetical protein